MAVTTKYNGTEISNINLGQAGVDIFTGSIATHSTSGRCEEGIASHTNKWLCETETGGLAPHTNAPGMLGRWKPHNKIWSSIMIVGTHSLTGSDVVLTPSRGDIVTLTYAEQVKLKGVKIPGPWETVRMGGTDSKIICYRS